MKPAAFDYARPTSKREALALLREGGDGARVLAGGQSLMAVLNVGLAQPQLMVDIGGLDELAYVERRKGRLAVGATVTQAQLIERPGLVDDVPLLVQALPWMGHFQTRNRGIVCGSMTHADPSAELPLCLVTLGGELVLEARKGGRRTVAAADFFQGVLTTDRRPGELLTEVRFPLREHGHEYRFTEMAMRDGDFALVSLAADIGGEELRLGVGGVADRPVVRRFTPDQDLTRSSTTSPGRWERRMTYTPRRRTGARWCASWAIDC